MDGLTEFKQMQKDEWQYFAPLEAVTTPAAARLVKFAGITKGVRVLDVGCGTGVVAITAARLGAHIRAVDLTPQLLERARENSRIAEVDVEWIEGDVEQLPFQDGEFEIVVSQFAHIFAPRPEVAIGEMLRVLRPGGTIAFSTWPPELLVGRTVGIQALYASAAARHRIASIVGDPNVVRQRLGDAVENIVFDRAHLLTPALSPQHYRLNLERSVGPMIRMVQTLEATNPDQLCAFRQEFDAVVTPYMSDNAVRTDYLLTRAKKR